MIRGPATWAIAACLACAGVACTTPPVSEPASATPPVAAPPAPVQAPPPAPVAAPEPPRPTAERELDLGVKSYEDGDYKTADKQLASALDMGLANAADQARAHKYRAFMVCVNGREKACRDEFRKALEADPAFALAPAEAGHPVWSQVVRSVKADLAKTKPKAK
jgi:Tfp pilus assembly protein PilF